MGGPQTVPGMNNQPGVQPGPGMVPNPMMDKSQGGSSEIGAVMSEPCDSCFVEGTWLPAVSTETAVAVSDGVDVGGSTAGEAAAGLMLAFALNGSWLRESEEKPARRRRLSIR